MKEKQLFLPGLILLLGAAAAVILTLFVCAAQKPVITQQSFPFSITYEFNGKTEIIEDEFVCIYTGPGQSVDPRDRFYDGSFARNRDEILCGDYLIQTYTDGELVLFTNFYAGYMMGDPEDQNYYNEHCRYEPYIAFYDYEDYMEYEDEEVLSAYDVRIVDWEYPQPIENDFVFSGITRLTPSNILPMVAVSLLTLLACILFVKKDRALACGAVDRVSLLLNAVVALVVLPFLIIACALADVNGNGDDLLSQIAFCIPGITGFSLAASVCLRRKGFGKASVAIQFTGVAVMALVLLAEVFV